MYIKCMLKSLYSWSCWAAVTVALPWLSHWKTIKDDSSTELVESVVDTDWDDHRTKPWISRDWRRSSDNSDVRNIYFEHALHSTVVTFISQRLYQRLKALKPRSLWWSFPLLSQPVSIDSSISVVTDVSLIDWVWKSWCAHWPQRTVWTVRNGGVSNTICYSLSCLVWQLDWDTQITL